MKRTVIILLTSVSLVASAQPPPAPPAGGSGEGDHTPVQGFTSKKSGKNMAKAGIEDLTNDDFPDMIESFDYPNADIVDIVKAISELTGKNFIVDPQVR